MNGLVCDQDLIDIVKEHKITSGFLERERKLILAENYLEYETGDLKGSRFTRLNKSDIADFKHGMDWIVWYRFTVGRQFSVSFKDKNNKELRILFDSYFGLHKQNEQLYADIVEDIWQYYHSDIVNTFLDKFRNSEAFEIQGIKINKDGVKLRGDNLLLTWPKVSIKEYYRYFAVYNKENPEMHSRISYNEYGTETLWGVLKAILKEENTKEEGS